MADLTPWVMLGVLCTGRPDIDRVCRGVEIPAETRAECLEHAATIRSMLPAHIRLIWQECQSERQQAARRALDAIARDSETAHGWVLSEASKRLAETTE